MTSVSSPVCGRGRSWGGLLLLGIGLGRVLDRAREAEAARTSGALPDPVAGVRLDRAATVVRVARRMLAAGAACWAATAVLGLCVLLTHRTGLTVPLEAGLQAAVGAVVGTSLSRGRPGSPR